MIAAVRAGGIYFALLFGLGFILGSLRQALMAAGSGRDALVALEIPAMLAYGWWAAGWCVRRYGLPPALSARLLMGLTMLLLLRLAEAGVGLLLMDMTPTEQAARLWTMRGALEMLPQVLTALFPALRLRFSP